MKFDDFIIDWDNEKNLWLQKHRCISFELIELKLLDKDIVDILKNPNQRFSHQFILLVNIDNYIYLVPFVIDWDKQMIFFKTIIPSRKYTKKYLNS